MYDVLVNCTGEVSGGGRGAWSGNETVEVNGGRVREATVVVGGVEAPVPAPALPLNCTVRVMLRVKPLWAGRIAAAEAACPFNIEAAPTDAGDNDAGGDGSSAETLLGVSPVAALILIGASGLVVIGGILTAVCQGGGGGSLLRATCQHSLHRSESAGALVARPALDHAAWEGCRRPGPFGGWQQGVGARTWGRGSADHPASACAQDQAAVGPQYHRDRWVGGWNGSLPTFLACLHVNLLTERSYATDIRPLDTRSRRSSSSSSVVQSGKAGSGPARAAPESTGKPAPLVLFDFEALGAGCHLAPLTQHAEQRLSVRGHVMHEVCSDGVGRGWTPRVDVVILNHT